MKDKMKGKVVSEEEGEVEDEYGEDKKRRALTHLGRKGSSGAGSAKPFCQVEVCTADMTDAKSYHRRHKVCEFHAKAPVVSVAGLRQRFCQQCSRFDFYFIFFVRVVLCNIFLKLVDSLSLNMRFDVDQSDGIFTYNQLNRTKQQTSIL